MEFFVLVSFFGTLALLTTQFADHVAETLRRPATVERISGSNIEAPVGKVPAQLEIAEEYDQAA